MFAEVVDRISGQVNGLSTEGVPRGGLVDGLAALGRLRGVLDAAEARFILAVGALDDKGADAATVLRAATRCSGREADRSVRRAVSLVRMPNVSAGLGSGAIPTETADALGRAAEVVSVEMVDSDTKLLDLVASRPADLAAREIRDWVRRHQQSDTVEKRLHQQRKARHASWFQGDDGMLVLHAVFDPVTGAGVSARLDARTDELWRSDGGRGGKPDDVRSSAQRRCDAVAWILGTPGPHQDDSDATGASNRRSAARPVRGGLVGTNVVVVADIGVISGADPDGRCELIDTGPVPASILATLGSDATWFGALFDGPGRPLWLGRGRRLASPEQKLILSIRDRGCINCGASTRRCHVHHTMDWQSGGTTDIERLALLCPRCHTLFHEGHIRLHRQPDGIWVASATPNRECHTPSPSSPP